MQVDLHSIHTRKENSTTYNKMYDITIVINLKEKRKKKEKNEKRKKCLNEHNEKNRAITLSQPIPKYHHVTSPDFFLSIFPIAENNMLKTEPTSLTACIKYPI